MGKMSNLCGLRVLCVKVNSAVYRYVLLKSCDSKDMASMSQSKEKTTDRSQEPVSKRRPSWATQLGDSRELPLLRQSGCKR